MTRLKIQNPDEVYFTSDLHFGHRLMTRLRGFSSGATNAEVSPDEQAEHDTGIANIINATVPKSAQLFILGDFAFHHKPAVVREFRSRISCETVHLIMGNHDDPRLRDDQAGFATVADYGEVSYRVNGVRSAVVLSHYPMVAWNGSGSGSIMLHGHQHGKGENPLSGKRRFDVGIDASEILFALGEATVRPWSFTEILSAAEGRTKVKHF